MKLNRDTCPEKGSGLNFATYLPTSAFFCPDYTCASLLHNLGIIPRTSTELQQGDTSHKTGDVKQLWQLCTTPSATPQPFQYRLQTTGVKMAPCKPPRNRQHRFGSAWKQRATGLWTATVSCGSAVELTLRKPLWRWGHAGAKGPTSSNARPAGQSQEAPREHLRTSA